MFLGIMAWPCLRIRHHGSGDRTLCDYQYPPWLSTGEMENKVKVHVVGGAVAISTAKDLSRAEGSHDEKGDLRLSFSLFLFFFFLPRG